MGKLKSVAQRAKDDFNAIQSEIYAINTRLEQISTLLKTHRGTYRKTRDIFVWYRKSTEAYFDQIKLPTIAALKQEYATLSAEKKRLYKDYHPKRKFMREVLTAEQNAKMMLSSQQTQRDLKRGDIERLIPRYFARYVAKTWCAIAHTIAC